MKYPQTVVIRDSTLRDGLQHEEHYISLEKRAELLELLIRAGVKRVEIGSVSHPLYLPQFREIDRFLKEFVPQIPCPNDMEYTVLALNGKAVSRVLDLINKGCRIDRVLTGQVATSEAYAKKNMNRSREELLAEAGENVRLLHNAGIKTVCANVGTIFGCPIQGNIPLEVAYEFTGRLFDMGFDEVEHSDPDGTATPDKVHEYFSNVMARWPDPNRHIFHAHDVRGAGILSYFSAMQEGITNFECALGGTGGQPANQLDGILVKGTGSYYFDSARTGLVSTEDFGSLLQETGIGTGISLDQLIAAGLAAEQILGRTLNSSVVAVSGSSLMNPATT